MTGKEKEEKEKSVLDLISSHLTLLSTSYSQLSSTTPPDHIAALNDLHSTLTTLQHSQQSHATSLLNDLKQKIATASQRLQDWTTALGEPSSASSSSSSSSASTSSSIPLDTQLATIDARLQALKQRMQLRGERILQLQKLVRERAELLGGVEGWLDDGVLEDESGGWEVMDLKAERVKRLEDEGLRADAELTRRRELITHHAQEIYTLRSELGMDQIDDPFEERILAHLGLSPNGQEEREVEELQPTQQNLDSVEGKRKSLEDLKLSRNNQIQTTYDQLYPLWTLLGVSESDMDAFVNKWMGSTSEVVNAYESELSRLLLLKRSHLSTFIVHQRTLLTSTWDALHLSPAERSLYFPPYFISIDPILLSDGTEEINENVTEDLLAIHEREREKWDLVYEEKKDILRLVEKYEAVVEEGKQLEASAMDPARLMGKATRGDPGRLLREEKARKRVAKEKPKLEAELRQLIPQWEQANDQALMIDGNRYLDELTDRMEREQAEKDAKKKPKSTIPPAQPLRAQKTGNSTTSTSSHAPLKRHLTGSSSAASHTTASSSSFYSTNTSVKATPAKKLVSSHTGGSGLPVSVGRFGAGEGVLGDIGNSGMKGWQQGGRETGNSFRPNSRAGSNLSSSVGSSVGGSQMYGMGGGYVERR